MEAHTFISFLSFLGLQMLCCLANASLLEVHCPCPCASCSSSFLQVSWKAMRTVLVIHKEPIFPSPIPTLFSFLRFYLFIFRERGRTGESEGEKHQWVVASGAPPTGDLACNLGMCPRLGTKLAGVWFAGWHTIHWGTATRAPVPMLLTSNVENAKTEAKIKFKYGVANEVKPLEYHISE